MAIENPSFWVKHKKAIRGAAATGALGAVGIVAANLSGCVDRKSPTPPNQPTTIPANTPTIESGPTFTAEPELAALLKEKCTPGIDLAQMTEAELATAKVNRENAVQFLSAGDVKFKLLPAEPLDPNLNIKPYLLKCKIPQEEGTRYAGVNLEAENFGKVDSYESLIDLLTEGGTRPISLTAARALPFFNQETSAYIIGEVDGQKPQNSEYLTYVRVLRGNGGECEEAVYRVVTFGDPLGRYQVGRVIDAGSDRGSLLGQDCVVGGAIE